MDSQEEKSDSYTNARDGIPVLASDSEESVIVIAERPSKSIQGPGIMRATQVLPTFSSSASDTCLSLGKSLITNICYL